MRPWRTKLQILPSKYPQKTLDKSESDRTTLEIPKIRKKHWTNPDRNRTSLEIPKIRKKHWTNPDRNRTTLEIPKIRKKHWTNPDRNRTTEHLSHSTMFSSFSLSVSKSTNGPWTYLSEPFHHVLLLLAVGACVENQSPGQVGLRKKRNSKNAFRS
jgi:hypothetical protein